MASLLVSQYQQAVPMVLNKFFHFSVHLWSLQHPSHLKLTCSWCGEINKPFHINSFQGSKSEFNLDVFDFFAFIKLLSYLIGIPFIKISRFSKLQFSEWNFTWELNLAIWQKYHDTAEFSSRKNFWQWINTRRCLRFLDD